MTPRCAYKDHKANSKKRGIAFLLTFEQWSDIWEQSGKFLMRGRRADQYVMARKKDRGPYAVGNVYITTARQNRLDSPMTPSRRRKVSLKLLGVKKSLAARQAMSRGQIRRYSC